MQNLTDFLQNDVQIEVYVADAESLKFVYANKMAQEKLGYSMEEFSELTPAILSPQFSPEELKSIMAPLKDGPTNKSVRLVSHHTAKDGTMYPVDVLLQCTDYKGKPGYIAFVIDATERQTELDQLHKVLDGSTLGYWDYNKATGIYFTDKNWLAMLGFKPGELGHDPDIMTRFIHPEDREWVTDCVRNAMKTREPYKIECRMVRKDGETIWVQATGSVAAWNHTTNSVMRMCGTNLDITERKQAELEKEQFLRFFEISTDIMLISDPFGTFKKVNPATVRILGYDEEELVSRPSIEFLHEDDRDRTMQEMENQVRTGKTQNFENRLVHKNGTSVWLSWTANFDDGNTYATGRDITAQKLVEEKLKYQEEMYHALVENSQDLIVQQDRQYRFIFVNPVATTLFGMNFEECLGKTPRDLSFSNELNVLWEENIDKAFVSGQPQFFSFTVGSPAEKRYIDCQIFPGIRNSKGEVESVFSVSRDVSHSRKVEDELQKMQRLESLGVLAGGIAHDFNNILTILFGNISIAKDLVDQPEKCLGSLENAEKAFHRAANLTGQLLTFAKGGDPLMQDISLGDLVRETVNFDLSGSKVRLNFEADPELWIAKVDKGQIAQVFSNLTINANQAMPRGGVLSISLTNEHVAEGAVMGLQAGRYIKAVVADEGVGIGNVEQGQIFDPFYSTKEGGSGLGLSTVYSIVSKHGGHISVTSSLGDGATFLLYLPVSETQTITQLPEQERRANEEKAGGRILLMDDESMIRDLVTEMLKEDGYQVDTAINGQEAIGLVLKALADDLPYTCMVMDLTIPGAMGGEEATREILALDPNAVLIVASGYAEDPVMSNYLDYGFKACLSKPFSKNDLLKTIGEILH